jgi:hypothetical protein
MRNPYTVLLGKHQGTKEFGIFTCRWGDNTHKDFTEIGYIDLGIVSWFRIEFKRAVL